MADTLPVIAAEPASPSPARHRPRTPVAARYATYPTPEHFDGRFGSPELVAALSRRRIASQTVCMPLAVQVRIPFHDSPHHGAPAHPGERIADYLDALEREVTLVVEQVGPCRSVARLHVGGDQPACLSDAQLARLMGLLRRNFHLQQDAEVAIEIAPAAADAQRLAHLRELGFDHLVLTLGDAAPEPSGHVADLVATARGLAFGSITVELAGDGPRTPHILASVAALVPDRIALQACDRPPAVDRPGQGADGAAHESPWPSLLSAPGYDSLGMGQFALHDDALARARRDGSLHMTPQGYRARPDHDVLGLGVAAIGRIGDCLYQNARTLAAYYGALGNDRLPVAHGHVLDADDDIRSDIIQALMCRGQVRFADIQARHGIDMRDAFAAEIRRLAPLVARGLVDLHGDRIDVTSSGRHAADDVAAVFDHYLHERARSTRPARTAR